MLPILRKSDDDKEFFGIVSRILSASIALYRPSEVFVVHMDNWFDVKWHAFSGKLLGALGVWKKKLTVPPFVLNRVRYEQHFALDGVTGDYVARPPITALLRQLHRIQVSSQNLNRDIRHISDSAIFLWFSGASTKTGRGSVMLYRVADRQASSWYASYHRAPDWKLLQTRNISRAELLHLTSASNQALQPAASRRE